MNKIQFFKSFSLYRLSFDSALLLIAFRFIVQNDKLVIIVCSFTLYRTGDFDYPLFILFLHFLNIDVAFSVAVSNLNEVCVN